MKMSSLSPAFGIHGASGTLAAPTGRLVAAAPAFWLALPLAALWPAWRWSAARLTDGSDDPLGVIALLALGFILYRDRRDFNPIPRALWLHASIIFAATATFSAPWLPWLLRSGLAVASLMAMVAALSGPRRPMQPRTMLPYWGLGFLALPLLSSLQFFVGYPLRVVTAQASAWLLELAGIAAVREGSAMTVNGHLVIVDAPCSGIQMAWFAYFTACIAASWLRLPDRVFLRRLPSIGLIVLLGNIGRNTVLVARETELLAWPEWTHEAVGIAVFAVVCTLVLRHVAAADGGLSRGSFRGSPPSEPAVPQSAASRALSAVAVFCFATFASVPLFFPAPSVTAASPTSASSAVEWPREVFGRDLRPLALSDVERNFAAQFPGVIARMTDGENLYTLRHVTHPTRKLHPSADCFRGLGYSISRSRLEQRNLLGASSTLLARCFVAEKDGTKDGTWDATNGMRVRVCEQIVDARGNAYTDASSWYWSALFGQTTGPWQAVTVATPL